MNHRDIHLLDLPVEILLNILRKLNNMDVLYSLIGIEGLDLLAQDEKFTNNHNFVFASNDSINEPMLNRFCNSILPRIQYNVKCVVLETKTMDRILRAGIYPNLTQLKIFKFQANIFSKFCTDELLLRDNFKKQITELTLLDDCGPETEAIDETTNAYIKWFDFFENLNSLSCIESCMSGDPVLSLIDLP
ncbi:unnamed protein product [Rotaria socialis]|uniref:F-box domain-containing protein n=1 Tax=Rotaria socialis TaxID=392032 RepID=A0A820BJW1_9BILA|nr:unnamed protein product [Rotaria socialis]CAF3343972.1 unnamed protein product [Rotaria socialis]CAF3600943.1 unnamed protein product [Rotaria socialis]CAF3613139.1 unnamed protein product [Rotaria socialis]CAF4202736.1 unnamed protein product [Rotaria socialis]